MATSTSCRYIYASLALALLGACATTSNEPPEQAVQRRSTAYWQARMAGDYKKTYELSTPSYRQLRTLEQHRSKFAPTVAVKNAEVSKVSCQADRCVATLKMTVQPVLPGLNLGTIPMYVDETWLLQDGQWWYFEEP
ncbi:hypothetical protein [Melaminivora suipulveris]|nr:hypothetical protein [Melaminivora suipulveris]